MRCCKEMWSKKKYAVLWLAGVVLVVMLPTMLTMHFDQQVCFLPLDITMIAPIVGNSTMQDVLVQRITNLSLIRPNYKGSILKPQTRFVSINTNTNFCAQIPLHNLVVCVFEHILNEFVPRSNAAYQSFLDAQTQTYDTIQNLTIYI